MILDLAGQTHGHESLANFCHGDRGWILLWLSEKIFCHYRYVTIVGNLQAGAIPLNALKTAKHAPGMQ
jgi:hypothetical protein